MLLCGAAADCGRASRRVAQDRNRTSNLHSWTTEFDGQPNREQRYQQSSQVVSAHPVTFERKVDPNK
jgi:hypothetical protein